MLKVTSRVICPMDMFSIVTEKIGVPMCTLEHSDFVFDSSLGTSIAITRAIELYLNHIMLGLDFYNKLG